ncbi:DUF3199 family protein [Sporosarcina sp. P17b]|uniref:protein YqbG n=1 Tax=Sporosarcina sp. P17b TaxID=2048260 RepID=UPI000C16C8B9|nr:DUF3199 family protein [Sporosarcina sp. P17b]PIC72527.1 hypothetical protein CSV76_14960 [Sporosarcina sp. P17b]
MIITPQDLKDYSAFEAVKERADNLLKFDILEAEANVQKQVEKPLADYVPLPAEIRLAILKVSQYFALINSDESISKGYKSEKIGDYSYTIGDGSSLTLPDVSVLLEDYAKVGESKTGFFMRVRPL